MRIRANLGNFAAATSKKTTIPATKPQIGKVFGVITTENTPTKELFEANGGWKGVGTVFYLDYEQSKNIDVTNLSQCKVAKPFHANIKKYPLIGEIIQLIDGPSPVSQVSNTSGQKYYTGTINIWNNTQQNVPSGDVLGKTFVENSDLRELISFEGDTIYQGRKGNGIRFGSTVKLQSTVNEWSDQGNDGDPITIMVNGYITTDTGSLIPNVEEVNKELSSLYMTSTQKIPLMPGAIIRNPFFSSTAPDSYFNNPQIILNSNRIILNSKKDEILLFSRSNIELNTDNILNLNAGEIIHLHVNEKSDKSRIMLGTNEDGSIPSEPVLLGGKTQDVLLEICNTLITLARSLSVTSIETTEGVMLISDCNVAGEQLLSDVEGLIDKISTISSTKVYTV